MQGDTFGVIGAGQMGGGIAQVAAANGMHVILHDISTEFVERGVAAITKNLRRSAEKGKISDSEVRRILERITPSTDMATMQSADFVVEAASENQEIKFKIFAQLDEVCPPHAILSSNTSSIPIGRIASQTRRPDKVIGMHFMNPVPVMKLVEIIRGLATNDETYNTVKELSEQMSKVPVEVNDAPGFVSNRVLIPMINEAIYCVYEGIATPEAVDQVMKLGMNHPMGPLALADLIGLDTCLYIMEVLYEGFGDSKYRPCPLLRKYVAAGWYGRKSGRGFYVY